MLHIFIDEAGVPGITQNFIIGFSFFPNKNYKLCVDNIKSKIKKLKGKEPLMSFGWKVLLPLALLNTLVTGLLVVMGWF